MIRAKFTIRHNDKEYKKGAILEGLKPEEEKRLVSLKAAEYVLSPEEELKKQQVTNDKVIIPDEEFNELRDALEELYNYDELKRTAKEAGVDLTNASKKDEIIAAVINQGKADELLEDEEDGGKNDE